MNKQEYIKRIIEDLEKVLEINFKKAYDIMFENKQHEYISLQNENAKLYSMQVYLEDKIIRGGLK